VILRSQSLSGQSLTKRPDNEQILMAAWSSEHEKALNERAAIVKIDVQIAREFGSLLGLGTRITSTLGEQEYPRARAILQVLNHMIKRTQCK